MPKNRGLMNDPWPHWPRESFSKWLNALEHNDRHRRTGCFCHLLNYSLQSVWWFSLFTLNWNIKALKSPSLYFKMQGRNVWKDIAKNTENWECSGQTLQRIEFLIIFFTSFLISSLICVNFVQWWTKSNIHGDKMRGRPQINRQLGCRL